MSKSLISDQSWAQMTEGQKVAAVLAGHATLKQLSEGLLDGSDQLRNACREFLAETDPSFEDLPLNPGQSDKLPSSSGNHFPQSATTRIRHRKPALPGKHRFGLPDDFVPRLHRYGRSVLLQLNVYRLPNELEFIVCPPTGTLGSRHLTPFSLQSSNLKGRRGSVYVRTDGRIFDYSVDNSIPLGDLFDTGFNRRPGTYRSICTGCGRRKGVNQ